MSCAINLCAKNCGRKRSESDQLSVCGAKVTEGLQSKNRGLNMWEKHSNEKRGLE